MAITDSFIKHFGDFVVTYTQNGRTSFYHWTKESNHSTVSAKLSDILELASNNRASFHDATIIEHLSCTILLTTQSNPYLLACWVEFIKAYNSATKLFAPLENGLTRLSINSSDKLSASMIVELEHALDSNKKIRELEQKTLGDEIYMLKRQVQELQKENTALKSENYILREQVDSQRLFASLHPQLVSAETQLSSLTNLVKELTEATRPKSFPTPVGKELETNSIVPERLTLFPQNQELSRANTDRSINTKTKLAVTASPSPRSERELEPTETPSNSSQSNTTETAPPPPPSPPRMAPSAKKTIQGPAINIFDELQQAVNKQKQKSQETQKNTDGEKKNQTINLTPLSC